jgi:ABC-type Fe3+-hydroxamate transport system substrate-binding protein
MGKNRTVWVIIGLLIVVFVIVGVVAGGGKKSKSKGATIAPVSARAVVLPANQTRTVVVPPCNTPVSANGPQRREGSADSWSDDGRAPAGERRPHSAGPTLPAEQVGVDERGRQHPVGRLRAR